MHKVVKMIIHKQDSFIVLTGLMFPRRAGQSALLQEYKMRLLLRCIQHFKTDLINNVDHMRISSTEPSSDMCRAENWPRKRPIVLTMIPGFKIRYCILLTILFPTMCVLLITRLLWLVGRLGSRKPF